jgi:hypothetical protein
MYLIINFTPNESNNDEKNYCLINSSPTGLRAFLEN